MSAVSGHEPWWPKPHLQIDFLTWTWTLLILMYIPSGLGSWLDLDTIPSSVQSRNHGGGHYFCKKSIVIVGPLSTVPRHGLLHHTVLKTVEQKSSTTNQNMSHFLSVDKIGERRNWGNRTKKPERRNCHWLWYGTICGDADREDLPAVMLVETGSISLFLTFDVYFILLCLLQGIILRAWHLQFQNFPNCAYTHKCRHK